MALKHIQKSNSSRYTLITACSHYIVSNVADMLFSFQIRALSSQVLKCRSKHNTHECGFSLFLGWTWSMGQCLLWRDQLDTKGPGSPLTMAPCAEPTHCDRDIKNEPNIISIEIVSMWGCFMCKIIPHQHQQQLLQDDRMPLLSSATQRGTHRKSLYDPFEA